MYVYKLIVLVLLGTITVVFTHCGSPFSSQSQLSWKSNIYGGGDQVSYDAFEATVYPITRANCASCHESQSPKHASPDVKEAHDEIMSSQKVNFTNVPNSRMIKKIADGHNCWNDCAADASEMQAAIMEWKKAIDDAGPAPTPTTPTTPTAIVLKTSQTMTIAQELANANNPLKSNTVAVNAGSAMVAAPMLIANDVFGDYIHVPNDGANLTLGAADATAGQAYFNIRLPTAGSYRIFAYVIAPNNNDNSFHVGLAPINTQNYIGGLRAVDFPVDANQTWRQMSTTFAVPAGGDYTLALRERKDGTKIYRIFVTADPAFDVTDVSAFLGVTLTFDISRLTNVPGTQFKIDVSDYSYFTYLLARPRIITTGSNIRVKNISVFVNGVRAGTQAYTNTDKIITPTDSLFNGTNLPVEKTVVGRADDKIHFEFEILAPYAGTVNNASLLAFQSSLYQVTRANCMSCHSAQRPHASPDPLTAHDYALTITNFTTPANSQIVSRIRNGHQGVPTNIATQLEAAIVEWRTGRGP